MNQNGSPIAIAAAIVAEVLALWADGFDTMEIVEHLAEDHCEVTEAQIVRLIVAEQNRRYDARQQVRAQA